jgi:hypothetical protein
MQKVLENFRVSGRKRWKGHSYRGNYGICQKARGGQKE